LGEAHLRRILKTYAGYYNKIRTHRSLDKDAPAFRPVQRVGNMRHTRSSVGFITITYGFRFSVQTGGPLYFGVLAAVVVFLIGQALRYVLAGANKSMPTRQRGMRIGIIVDEIFALAGCLRIPPRTCPPSGYRQSTN
jgi:hypothetical protein